MYAEVIKMKCEYCNEQAVWTANEPCFTVHLCRNHFYKYKEIRDSVRVIDYDLNKKKFDWVKVAGYNDM